MTAHLEELQCHFTWDLRSGSHSLKRLRDQLLDICPQESHPWRGHIYNLLGFIQARLGNSDEALSLFSSASEVLKGPSLLVNYSDLAWFHHERGETVLSQEYLQRVEELSQEYLKERDHPADPREERLHPEVLAEKAWTLMKLDLLQKREAVDLFERALEEQPQRVEWRSSQAIALLGTQYIKYPASADKAVVLKMQKALEEDSDNLYLSALYLLQRAKSGEQVKEEVAELRARIIPNAYSSHSGLKIILQYYRFTEAVDEAIVWAEEVLKKHPDSRYVKRCTALCYKWRVVFYKDGASQHHLVEKGVSLLEELITLYPDSGLKKEIDLAQFYCKLDPNKAEEIYQALLQRHLDPPETQMLYNYYAAFIYYTLHDRRRAIKYHYRAALIDHESSFRSNSIGALQKLTNSSPDSDWAEIRSRVHLEELQCHFTWDLSSCRVKLLRLQDQLLDICPEESHPWRGHIYNLMGFIQARLGNSDEALSLFRSASEVLKGPSLLVNYSDLFWLHHERGETALSQEYLQRVEELSLEYLKEKDQSKERDHPADSREEQLHPEVLAEKAWTLMKLGLQQKRVAVDLFERALEEQPQRVEWRSSQAIALLSVLSREYPAGVELQKVQRALEEDPGNLYLRAEYLLYRAKSGEQVEEEVAELASHIIPSAQSSYSGLKIILSYYRLIKAEDEAIYWAEEALAKHPDSRYVKSCTAQCYIWRVVFCRDGESQRHLVEKGVSLLKEVISLYPSAPMKEIDMADFYGKSKPAKGEELYQTLLQRDLDPPNAQMLYNRYAKFLINISHNSVKSLEYHMRAAEIPVTSSFRTNSITTLRRVRPRNEQLQREINQFLSRLHVP